MELSWLRTFTIAAENLNFRKTAEQLFISQPSVTIHIKNLEKELGTLLFQREGKRILLTEEGKRYLIHARQLLQFQQKGIEDLHAFKQGYAQKLTIAISPLIADTILPFALKRYVSHFPEVEVHVKIIESVDIEQAVLTDKVDLGLSALQGFHPHIHNQLLYEDTIIMVTGHDGYDFESAPPLLEEELLTEHYLLTHNHPSYWDELMKKIHTFYPRTKTMKVSQIHITKRFIAEGLGVSYLPASTVRRELLEGRLLEVQSQRISLPKAKTFAVMKDVHKLQRDFLHFVSQYRF
ncbi:LysR family transcriptional regulator [Alkalihalobacillus pseudalcaliphilus]|uniref:LysR family transcriptional regulator n=1 Tax=Alkalihalobacillus pseudalcaliphilus TaxID=79884 RepID=UPI00064DDD58|nr:LysR family transcriptional regulator [Alkalihalobacillus pseudalcaliphilus]KMK75881.1 LysR family transcriptional regulator [Alkalihalobacillus pseudalcaliphilus]